MKNIIIKLLVPSILLWLSACTKIDQQIYDTQTTATIKTQADVEVAITGLYSQLTSWSGFKEQFPVVVPPYADDLSSITSIFGTKVGINSGTSNIYNIWSRFYQTISNANQVIYYTDSLNLSASYKAKARAEAKFIRGLCYFYLVQYFGPVPITTTVFNYQSNFKPSRNSVDSVYQLIFSDFNEGVVSLPLKSAQSNSQYNRATQGAAQGFLAKAYLTYGNYLDLNNRTSEAQAAYANAETAASGVIASGQYILLNDFAKLWDVNNKLTAYNEVIFGISYTHDYTTTDVTGNGSVFATTFNPTTRANICGYLPGNHGLGQVRVHPWFYEKYTNSNVYPSAADYASAKDTDYRVQTSFLTSWVITSTNPLSNGKTMITFPFIPGKGQQTERQPYINKYIDPNGVASGDNANDLFLLRFSEIYLIEAEAENEMNGPTATALSAFNMVRQRARMANGITHTSPIDLTASAVPNKEAMRMKIFDERGLEFVGEMNRWFDLVRMHYSDNVQTMYQYQFGTFLPSLPQGTPVYTAKTKSWSAGRTELTNIIPYDKKYLLFPIPSNEVAVNSNLLPNNYGW